MQGKVRKDKFGPNGDAGSTRISAQALQLVRYLRKWELSGRSWPVLRSLTLYAPAQNRTGSWLVVGKAWGEQGGLVAFSRSSDPLTAMVGFLQKWIEGKLVWKEDKPYDSPLRSP